MPDQPRHEPSIDCNCHACALWERDKLREIVGALRYPLHADDRRTAQTSGEHPAPCPRFCEANAFEIEIRMLRRKLVEAVLAERDACLRIIDAPHWKPAVRNELQQRAEQIRQRPKPVV